MTTQDTSVDTLVILTTGKQDRGARAVLAFSWACTAAALGKSVQVFLTMDGAVWAMKDACKGVVVAGFEPLGVYLEQLVDLGGSITVCAPCTEYYCGVTDAGAEPLLHHDVAIVGLTTVVSQAGPSSQVVTF